MLDKLIKYLKNLPEEEQKKLMQSLQDEQTIEQDNEQAQESRTEEQESEQVEESTEQTQEQEVENVEEEQKDEIDNEQVEETEQQEQPVQEKTDKPTNQESTEETSTVSQDLLDTKIELALVKAGIREDRVEAAKRLFKTEIHGLEDLEKIKDLIKEFPEWQKVKNEHGKGFGIPIKENGTSLTEEEKKLKSMGIDPKN